MVSMIRMLEQRATRTMARADIAERLETSTRTIDRYVKALAGTISTEEGEPLLQKELRDGKVWIVLARESSTVAAGIYQYASVWAATRFLKAGKGSVLSDTADGLLARLGGAAKLRPRRLVDRLSNAFCYIPFGPKDYRANEEALDALVQATLWQRPVRVGRVTRRGDRVEEQLEPLTIIMYRDGLYLLARKDGAEGKEERLFAIERIVEATIVREETIDVPQDFDPSRRFADRLGLWEPKGRPVAVEIAFTPAAAEIAAKRVWPGFKGWRTSRDGRRRILELKIPLSPEVKTWVLGWGTQAEVLKPKKLRDMVADELRGTLAQYF